MSDSPSPVRTKVQRGVIGILAFIGAVSVVFVLLLIVVFGINAMVATPEPADDDAHSSQQNEPYVESTPDVLTTKQPLVSFSADDYPCSADLYKIRNRAPKGSFADEYDDQAAPTTKYCNKVKADVERLGPLTAKVNHLVVEYCKVDSDERRTNLEDIYGSLYGTIKVTYDESADLYDTEWVQNRANDKPAYFMDGKPSLEPIADKYCPEPEDAEQTPTQLPVG